MTKYKPNIKFILNLSAYIILIVAIIILLVKMFYNPENFGNILNNIPYIYPSQLEPLCGLGTKAEGQRCVPDNNVIMQTLIDQKFIKEKEGEIIFTPDYNPDKELPPVLQWYTDWINNGAYSCQKVISWGKCNIPGNNCNAPCQCGDCAGWRGGNITDCDSVNIGKGRVWCNLEPGEPYTFKGEPDKCECAYGYCAVNGLCVSPFKMDGTKDNKRCCPECAFKSPDKQGGCSGSVMCDPSIKCEEAKVEIPGKQYKFDTNQFIEIINKKCSTPNEINCYHPENKDAKTRQPYVKVKTSQSNNLQSLIGTPIETAHGQNEYDCALKCGEIQNDTEFTGTIKFTTGKNQRQITIQTNTSFSYNEIENGDFVTITGVEGNTNANGTFMVNNVQPGTEGSFRLVDSISNGEYKGGGTFVRKKRYKTLNSQVECSKRCLPKLWRWYPIFEETNDGLNYTGGYYQSDELMRYLPSNESLKICPPETCETERSVTEFDQFNNCTECENCKYEYANFPNGNGFYDSKYTCERCNQCLLTQPDGLNNTYQVSCKNMVDCNTCINAIQSTVIQGVNYNECDTCLNKDPNDPKSGCKIYTLDPYQKVNGTTEFHPQVVTYNHGADPFVDYTDVTEGYDPNTRDSKCNFYIVSGRKTCDNSLNGKQGWGDGFFYNIGNCTKKC